MPPVMSVCMPSARSVRQMLRYHKTLMESTAPCARVLPARFAGASEYIRDMMNPAALKQHTGAGA